MDEWMDGWTDGLMDGRKQKQITIHRRNTIGSVDRRMTCKIN